MTNHDIPPPYDPCFPHASGPNSYTDVDGREIFFTGDDPTGDRDLYLAVAQSTLLNFRRIFDAMTAILYPHCPPDGPFEPPNIKQLLADARRDADLLKLPLPVETAFAIWQRSCDGLRLCASLDKDEGQRQAILDAVEQSEARMAERMAQHVQIRDRYLSALYRNLYAQWERGNQLGREEVQRDQMFPSTWENSRGAGSPLGTGFARPAAEIKKEN